MLIVISLVFMNHCTEDEKGYYVSITGNDSTGNGTAGRPWRTLGYAVTQVSENMGYPIKLAPGTYIEKNFIRVPPGVTIIGAGKDLTIIKPHSTLYSATSGWNFDKFLIALEGSGGDTKQALSNFTIDGASKQLYGAILVKDRNNVLIRNIRIQYTFYTGIWLWNTKDCRITQSDLKDCAWGDSTGASGSIILSIGEGLEVDHCNIDEKYGQALEAKPDGKMYDLKLHDNKFSVSPKGNWKTPEGQLVPNLCVELFHVELKGCKIFNNYFDNTLSIAMDVPKYATPTGVQTVRVYNNTFDLISRAKGSGTNIELTLHDAEIDHNYFFGGYTGIANWNGPESHIKQNWKIHHNIFYKLASFYPSAVIRLFRRGVTNAEIYNNTVELSDTSTINFIEVNNGGIAYNVNIKNNLIINSNTAYNWYPNKLINVINNGSFEKSSLMNNSFINLQIDSISGITFANNITADPKLQKRGERPIPYYCLLSESPLIDKGSIIDNEYSGAAPDIGAIELEQLP